MTVFGVNAPGDAQPAHRAIYGTMGYVRFFFSPGKHYSWRLWPLNQRQPGDVPVISVKTWHEADFRVLLDDVPDDVPEWYFAYYHEPEDEIMAGVLNAQAHAATYAKMLSIRDAHPRGTRCQLITILNWYALVIRGFDWRRLEGSLDHSDMVGVDSYSHEGDLRRNVYTTPQELFAPALAITEATGKPWCVPEFGVDLAADGDQARRANQLVAHIDQARANDCVWMSYWCQPFAAVSYHLEQQGCQLPLLAWRTAVRATALR